MCPNENTSRTTHSKGNEKPPGLHEFRHGDHKKGERRKLGSKAGENLLELWYHEYQQDSTDDAGDNQNSYRVTHGALDFLFEGFGFFLVGRYLVQQRFKGT